MTPYLFPCEFLFGKSKDMEQPDEYDWRKVTKKDSTFLFTTHIWGFEGKFDHAPNPPNHAALSTSFYSPEFECRL